MKQMIFGVGLMICGIIARSTLYLRDAIYFASSNNIINNIVTVAQGFDIYIYNAMFIIGLSLCIIALIHKDSNK